MYSYNQYSNQQYIIHRGLYWHRSSGIAASGSPSQGLAAVTQLGIALSEGYGLQRQFARRAFGGNTSAITGTIPDLPPAWLAVIAGLPQHGQIYSTRVIMLIKFL